MHASPAPAHPSYRLITALRLYHHLSSRKDTGTADVEPFIDEWRHVIQGETDCISDENERLWRGTAEGICVRIARRAKEGLETVEQLTDVDEETKPEWFAWMQNNVRLLWQEESGVATRVLHSVQSGEEF